jgi:Tol biopolymer transport system component
MPNPTNPVWSQNGDWIVFTSERSLPKLDAPATRDLALYTNTSPGKAVRVREVSVF